MGLYEIAKIAVGVVIFIIGALMFFAPKVCMKKSEREIEYAVKDTKKRGVVLMVIGALLAVVLLALPFITGLMA
jgi:uncharacterized protein YjeT (DUF2065 family)